MPKVLIETQYFPTIAFFALSQKNGGLILDQHENYNKGSYRNRTYIMSSQGALPLSIPLKGGKNNQMNIRKVQVDYSENWPINHLRSIEACYGKSPYFEYYINEIIALLEQKHDFLFDFNLVIIEKCVEILKLEKQIALSEMFVDSSTENIDLKRGYISPKKKEQGRLAEVFDFKYYDQVFSDEYPFVPNLSILDLIFCLGPEARMYLASIVKE